MFFHRGFLGLGLVGLALCAPLGGAGTPHRPVGAAVFLALGPERGFNVPKLERGGSLSLRQNTSSPASKKNPRLAMLYSLLLPGMGEIYLGHKNRGTGFLSAEAGVWIMHFVFTNQADTRKRRYREYAFAKAHVFLRDDDELYRQLGIYNSSDGPRGANETIRRVARAKFPNDRDAQDAYVLENGYFGADGWEWESAAAFEEYGDMRGRTLDSEENARLSLGLLVANRLLSVVDTGLLGREFVRKMDDGSQAGLTWDVHVGPKGPHARVVLSRSF